VTGRAKPSDLPTEFPRKLELVIILNTAKPLGLAVPPTLLARAEASAETQVVRLIAYWSSSAIDDGSSQSPRCAALR
jgi:hypothetical protein